MNDESWDLNDLASWDGWAEIMWTIVILYLQNTLSKQKLHYSIQFCPAWHWTNYKRNNEYCHITSYKLSLVFINHKDWIFHHVTSTISPYDIIRKLLKYFTKAFCFYDFIYVKKIDTPAITFKPATGKGDNIDYLIAMAPAKGRAILNSK